MNPEKYYSKYREIRQNTNKFRNLLLPDSHQRLCDFSTNDYLGLSSHPNIIAAAHKAADSYGVGATGSRLLSGNNSLFMDLEVRIAQDKNTESALIFNSGYQANISVLAALLDKATLHHQALVFCDKANHNSLYQGIALSGAHLVRYHHGDMEHLAQLLRSFENDPRPKFIVSETLFGMDGDIVPLETLMNLAQTFGAFLYLDEAHATGVLGPYGYGLSTTIDLSQTPHLIMGTFSKALGSCGGYIACSQITQDYLVNHCSGFIYTTALSPMVIGAVTAAWDHIPFMAQDRIMLLQNAADLRELLREKGIDIGLSSTHIIPIILGDEERTMKAKDFLIQKGLLVSAIRPPTVPQNKARLRIALTTQHTKTDIDALFAGLNSL